MKGRPMWRGLTVVFSCVSLMLLSMLVGCGATGNEDDVGIAEEAVGTLSITGIVVDAQSNPRQGVSMTLSGAASATTTTGPDGSYAFTGLAKGNYTVQPTLTGCTFAPTSGSKNLNRTSATLNFGGSGSSCGGSLVNSGATSGSLTISGTVTDSSGGVVPGVRIMLSGGTTATRTTTATGTYSFNVSTGMYTLTPAGSCAYTPSVTNLGTVKKSKTSDFVRTGCHGPDAGGSDSGASDAKTDSDAKDGNASDANDGSSDAADAADVCVPATTCPAGQDCGSAPDGCGGTINCGSCTAPQTCGGGGVTNQCGCTPATTCPAGQDCGSTPDGCGGTISCGSCAAPQTCGGAGVPNQCGCSPITACAAGQNCGTVPDGCGGTINCGTCTDPQVCAGGGVPNQCAVPPPVGCDLSTDACLATRDNPSDPPDLRCSQCAIANGCLDPAQMGGRCEDTAGIAPAACGPLVGTQSAPTESQVCLKTLKNIFASQCAATLQLAPCLCGSTDVGTCLAGTEAPNGPLLPMYTCDFMSSNVQTIQSDFAVQTFGAGQANALAQCLGAYGCNCF